MTYPDDVMHTFHQLALAVGVDHYGGPLVAHVPDRSAPGGVRVYEIPCEHLDELVAK